MEQTKIIELEGIGDLSGKANVKQLLIKKNQHVKKNESILVGETKEAIFEIPSPFSGWVKKVLINSEDTLLNGMPLIEIKLDEIQEEIEETELESYSSGNGKKVELILAVFALFGILIYFSQNDSVEKNSSEYSSYTANHTEEWKPMNRYEALARENAYINESVTKYASQKQKELAEVALSVKTEHVGSKLLMFYEMPDGRLIKCVRGMEGDVFTFNCND